MTDHALAPPALLQNMSAPPQAAINHAGVRPPGAFLWLEVPSRVRIASTLSAAGDWIGVTLPKAPREAQRTLCDIVNAHAPTLPYPPACVVTSEDALKTDTVLDPLTIVTVLSKSSGHVYLRDKEPNFDRLSAGVGLVLVIPNEWSPK